MRTIITALLLVCACAGTPGAAQSGLPERAARAQVIVVAEVVEVGESPGAWSGYVLAEQFVTYRVAEVVKGDLRGERFEVGFLITSISSLVDKDRPRLSPKVFAPGRKHVLLLKAAGEGDAPAQVPVADGRGKISFVDRSEFTGLTSFTPDQLIDLVAADAATVETLRNLVSAK